MINNRYDFVMLFDVENGNPNGDPDFGNMPRMDTETGYGIVTDVCLKRKIRNYIELIKNEAQSYKIFIKDDIALNLKLESAYKILNIPLNSSEKETENTDKKSKKPKINRDAIQKAMCYMCENYYDIRMFGAVMTTGKARCGRIRGPVQINFAKSISPIFPEDITISRMALTTEEEMQKQDNTFGKKSIIPYALYRAEGHVDAALANRTTDLSEEDIELLWEAIWNMFEHDKSAARGKMIMRKLYIFKHDSELGNAHSHVLFDKIKVSQKDMDMPPRSFNDYSIEVDNSMPNGVELICKE